jgi:arginine-tRNA-protein transferase
MNLANPVMHQGLHFYISSGYPCGYLANKEAISLIAAPPHLIDTPIYSKLMQQGFRRSGLFVYKPHCENCQACVPVRLPVLDFVPSRGQKRAMKQHEALNATVLAADFYEEHYALYAQYQQARHAKHSNDQDSEVDDAEQYRQFLCKSNVETVLVEFRDGHQLKMVSVIDVLGDGLSAVYTFYDPHDKKASLGTYNVLWQIARAKALQRPYLYLGYWIKDSQKMAYKQNFQPLEKRINGEWREDSPVKK